MLGHNSFGAMITPDSQSLARLPCPIHDDDSGRRRAEIPTTKAFCALGNRLVGILHGCQSRLSGCLCAKTCAVVGLGVALAGIAVGSLRLVRPFPALIVDIATELSRGLRARPPVSAWSQRYIPSSG